MNASVEQLTRDGVLAEMQIQFASLIGELDATGDGLVPLAAAMVSQQLSRGHVLLDLTRCAELTLLPDSDPRSYDWPAVAEWEASLAASSMVTCVEGLKTLAEFKTPLVLDTAGHHVYLARYWYFQQSLAADVLSRCDDAVGEAGATCDDEQSRAIERCMTQRLTMIAGGPGTGKTTTVTRLLARWIAAGHDASEIMLMAPTGKAANRLNQSLAIAIDRLDVDPAIVEALHRLQASTIHRALQYTPAPPERGGPFRHTRSNPLRAGLIVVDEASMIDMELMSYLFAAIGPRAHVVLLGDPDQLVSVEAGSVFGDLVADDSPAAGCVARLTVSHRFTHDSTLGQLAACIRDGDADGAIEYLRNNEGGIEWLAGDDSEATRTRVVELAGELYAPYLQVLAESPDDPARALGEFNRFRVLCATHHSWRGDRRMNRAIADCLTSMGLLPEGAGGVGRPIMVQTNAYRQELYNGDTGIIVRDGEGRLQAIMEGCDAEGGPRIVPAGLLPPAVDAWAETIHKSQGSEFHQVMVLLPESCNALVSRELLYTAVTRVCDEGTRPGRLVLVGSEAVVRRAINTRVQRHSNLRGWTR